MFNLIIFSQVLQIATIVLAPLVVLYALIAYKGEYESRSLPSIIALAILIGASTFFRVAADLNNGRTEFIVLQDFTLLLAVGVLLLVLRSYVHSEIHLINSKKWLPRAIVRQNNLRKLGVCVRRCSKRLIHR